MNNELQQIAENVKNEMNYRDGVVYFTISGSARLIGVSRQALSRSLGATESTSKLGKFLSQCGINPATLDITNQGVPDFVHAMITKYYSQYAGDYCTQLAKQADLAFTAIGVREWSKKILGIEDKKDNSNLSALELFEQMVQTYKEQQLELQKQQEQLSEHDIEINEAKETLMNHSTEIDELKNRIEEYRNSPTADDSFKITIRQYRKMKKIELTSGDSISTGKKLTKLCDILHVDYNENSSGQANEYPFWLLKALFDTEEEFKVDFEEMVGKYLMMLQTEGN